MDQTVSGKTDTSPSKVMMPLVILGSVNVIFGLIALVVNYSDSGFSVEIFGADRYWFRVGQLARILALAAAFVSIGIAAYLRSNRSKRPGPSALLVLTGLVGAALMWNAFRANDMVQLMPGSWAPGFVNYLTVNTVIVASLAVWAVSLRSRPLLIVTGSYFVLLVVLPDRYFVFGAALLIAAFTFSPAGHRAAARVRLQILSKCSPEPQSSPFRPGSET